jgi:hypothetical protein
MALLTDDEPQDGFKKIKARKAHTCDNCHKEVIKPGDKYFYGEWREPRYATVGTYPMYQEEQIGIYYVKYRVCLACDKILRSEDPIEDMSEYDLPRFSD